jgi:2-amino-4-hydroxy-6-hydroxymethyldihydropteridine diphosphokinase
MEKNNKTLALLLIGGNMGEVKKSFSQAISQLESLGNVLKRSSIYSSPSWGFNAPDFLNQAIIIDTKLSPHELLTNILKIEEKIGRIRNEKGYQSRLIDIDIILIKNTVINSDTLVVPHPKMHLRKFVLIPCEEIAADWKHPTLNSSIANLIQNCEDTSLITKVI